MTQDGLLSLVALVLAALGFLPAARRLRLRATLSQSAVVTMPSVIAVLYFEFYPAMQLPCPELLGDTCRALAMRPDSPFGPRDAAFALVIVWSTLMWWIYRRGRLGVNSLPALASIAEDLARERDWSTLVQLVEPHVPLIDRTARRRLLRQRHYTGDPKLV